MKHASETCLAHWTKETKALQAMQRSFALPRRRQSLPAASCTTSRVSPLSSTQPLTIWTRSIGLPVPEVVPASCCAAIKKRGKALLPNCLTGYFSSSDIMRLLDDRPGRPGFATLFAQKGIRVVVCKKITGLEPGDPSAEPDVRTFLWVELVDEAVMAEPGQVYNSAQAIARSR